MARYFEKVLSKANDLLKDEIVYSGVDSEVVNNLADVIEYVQGCSYTKRKNAMYIVSNSLSKTNKEIAIDLGINLGNVNVTKRRIDDDFISAVGTTFFDALSEKNFDELKFLMSNANKATKELELLCKDLPKAKADIKNTAINQIREDSLLDLFADELAFIAVYNKESMYKHLQEANPYMVDALLQVLNGKLGTLEDRLALEGMISSVKVNLDYDGVEV